MRDSSRWLAVAALVVCTGCILAVDSASGGFSTTCGFASSDSACGQCITSNCQPTLDACCGKASCARSLDALDKCAAGDCSAIESNTNQPFSSVTACVTKSCATSCAFTLATETTCTVDATSGVVCGCNIPQSGSGNTTACTPPAGGLCCADPGWPAGTTSCECIAPVCSTYVNECACETTTLNAPSAFVPSCKSTYCCVRPNGTCSCSTGACQQDDVQVTECTPADVTCGDRQIRVPQCSAP